MEAGRMYSKRIFGVEVIAVVLALLFLVPFYFVLVNSVKTFADILLNSAALPTKLEWGNYSKVWTITNFPRALLNSFLITAVSNIGIVLISTMAAYRMQRFPSRFNAIFFMLLVAAMVIPFQSVMIPLIKVMSTLSLSNSILGIVICYFGFGLSMSLFLFHGFVKGIPREIEESAVVDGCGPFAVFFKIIMPLLRPIIVTVVLLNSLWIWNDFLLPLLVLGQKPEVRTIPLSIYSFFGQYTKQWDLALAALVMSVMPIVVFFMVLQKHIVEGITAGSIKG
ncbi:carbohydrate ABC transporter permease [Paenibacillus sp. N1-5-1-14]|uniref:carbohydrate ABC transporter permease n=1 Tax=Paenibacillus radicibacter TaxID=2972488 RepID=UPI00215918CA|nr:carbohydrate ABC transporter permease [Paenibacillus radicibacter]MCR8645125.1 carbohydrate ABC transporter permease [Paenibacillus radicibacter]